MSSKIEAAGLRRRLAAISYDFFLIVALFAVASVPVVLLNGGAIEADGSLSNAIKQWAYIIYMFTIGCLFYAWFWTHGGQTLGMSAWKIQVVADNGQALGWRSALIRSASACLGLANISCLFSAERLAWHERLSNSRTIHMPKKTSKTND